MDDDTRIARTVGWRGAFTVGAAQSIALIPGFSRSGAAMGGSFFKSAKLSVESLCRWESGQTAPVSSRARRRRCSISTPLAPSLIPLFITRMPFRLRPTLPHS